MSNLSSWILSTLHAFIWVFMPVSKLSKLYVLYPMLSRVMCLHNQTCFVLVFHKVTDLYFNWCHDYYLAPHRGRARYCNAHVCLFVCVFVCPCFRKISKCNISAISQPIIMKLCIHITYGYTVTDKYFQRSRS